MRPVRRPALVVGLASSLVGLLLVASPTLATVVDVPNFAVTLSLVLVGVVALTLAAGTVLGESESRSASDDSGANAFADLPEIEHRPRYPRPGTAFVRRLEAIEWSDRREDEPTARLALRSELTAVAVDALSRTKGWTRREVASRLDDGNWTENPDAAAFFADDIVPPLSIREHLRAMATSEPPFARRARHATAELAGSLDDSAVSPRTSSGSNVDDRPAATVGEFWPDRSDPSSRDRLSGRVHGAIVASLVAGGLGIFVRQPGLLLVALFGIAVAGYARATPPPPVDVEITRTVTETSPDPGQELTVSVSVQNAGDSVLPDLRILDGVPAGLAVTDGSPRFATALRPGKRATFSYTVEAVEGSHEFDPALLVARDFVGVHERRLLASGSATRIECVSPGTPAIAFDPKPRVTVNPGQTQVAVRGVGVEFHSIRAYRPGDPRSRIDWNRKAKTGELATIDFLEPRRARSVVLIDAREEAYLASASEGGVPVVRQCIRAGHCVVDALLDAGTPVGVAALSPRPCWIPPGAGREHGARVRNALTSSPAFDWQPPGADVQAGSAVAEIRTRLTRGTRIVVISPMCDDEIQRIASYLDASGRSVTVVSPDPTGGESLADCAHGFARAKRDARLRDLRDDGIAVTDWDPTDPFEEVMGRAR